jgi:hypothetical protein
MRAISMEEHIDRLAYENALTTVLSDSIQQRLRAQLNAYERCLVVPFTWQERTAIANVQRQLHMHSFRTHVCHRNYQRYLVITWRQAQPPNAE